MDNKNKTFFGFKKVSSDIKQGLVNQVFSSVSDKYDLMNDLMSFGNHRLWKKKLVEMIPSQSVNILDVASGTADIAIAIKSNKSFVDSEVALCDINFQMLHCGRNKMIDKNIIKKVSFVVGDAQNLPYQDNVFDCYIIAFGIRNVPNIAIALQEAFRVLKPGGKFLCLELSMPEAQPLSTLYDFYSFNIIPTIGRLVTKKKEAYQYLVESIRTFPLKTDFKKMISNVGFKDTDFYSLTLGVAAIHSGYK